MVFTSKNVVTKESFKATACFADSTVKFNDDYMKGNIEKFNEAALLNYFFMDIKQDFFVAICYNLTI